MISAFIIHFVNVMILVGYLKFIFGINLSGGWELVLLVLVGSISGVAMGMLIGSIGRFSEGVKVGISLAISMVGSFLSGLMFGGMKNVVEQHVPIVNKINPASLISDAVYAISVYDNSERFYLNIGILLLESVIFLFVCYLSVRRVRYDSI
jgi:ABC-2 type transport system permease protein